MDKSFVAIGAAGFALALGGCSSTPDKISAQYVSPLQYNSYDCDQVGMELRRVSRRLVEVSGVQQKEADNDAVAMGVGLVLFWPALFFLAGDDHAAELGRLKGEYEALEVAAIHNKCEIADELEKAREERAKKEQKAKEKLQEESIID